MGLGLTLHHTQEVNASLCFHRFTCTPYNLRTEERAPDFRNLESVQIKLNKNRAQLPQRAAHAAVAVVLFAELESAREARCGSRHAPLPDPCRSRRKNSAWTKYTRAKTTFQLNAKARTRGLRTKSTLLRLRCVVAAACHLPCGSKRCDPRCGGR